MFNRFRTFLAQRRQYGLILVHIFVILGLVAAGGVARLADSYFNRGVVAGTSELSPIPYTDLNPVGVNTFLDQEPDPEVVKRSMDMISVCWHWIHSADLRLVRHRTNRKRRLP